MDASVICHRLDLLVRLVDTTTGFTVEERDVRFWWNEERVYPIPRGNGNFIFINCGREDFSLKIRAYGYEEGRESIQYEHLDSQMPIKEVFLIPSENTPKGQPIITFSGRLAGITAIEAVAMGTPDCCISEFDERRKIMKLFKTRRVGLGEGFYGLIFQDRQGFEPFEVVRELSEASVKVKEALQEPFSVNSPIARIIFGRITPGGDYCIRVRDDADELIYLIRYVVEGKVKFQRIDFHHMEEVELT